MGAAGLESGEIGTEETHSGSFQTQTVKQRRSPRSDFEPGASGVWECFWLPDPREEGTSLAKDVKCPATDGTVSQDKERLPPPSPKQHPRLSSERGEGRGRRRAEQRNAPAFGQGGEEQASGEADGRKGLQGLPDLGNSTRSGLFMTSLIHEHEVHRNRSVVSRANASAHGLWIGIEPHACLPLSLA